jgi:hypothetical protein
MQTRRTSHAVTVVLVCMLALTPLASAVLQAEECLENIPVQGPVMYDGSFVGSLTIAAFTFSGPRQLLLTGVLNGTVTNAAGAKTKVQNRPFTAPATVTDSGWATDVLFLDVEPILLDSLRLRIRLAEIILGSDAILNEGTLLVKLLNYDESEVSDGW